MKPDINKMSLREKIGQTGMPSPGDVRTAMQMYKSYAEYFKAFPFCGLYLNNRMLNGQGEDITSAKELNEALQSAGKSHKIPIFISCDAEYGGRDLLQELSKIPSNMALGAADSEELAFKRSNFWAKELREKLGVNYILGPVSDMAGGFFSPSGVRCISDNADTCIKILPYIIKGIQSASVAATAKHYPGHGKDYRDPHFSMSADTISKEDWDKGYRKIWTQAVKSGVKSVMVGHTPVPSLDNSHARGKNLRPASASKKIIDILRNEIGFNGVIISDAVNMKGMSAAFTHEDVYIECFNAGNDIVLFCHDDYIDIMEKAVLSGRVSEKRIDESVGRILKLKEELGLFEDFHCDEINEKEKEDFEKCCYDIAKKAITLINNENSIIPFQRDNVKKVTIIKLSPYAPFMESIHYMKEAFLEKGINVTVLEKISSKKELCAIANTSDIIIYACFLAQFAPRSMSFFSTPEDMNTLFYGLSFGAEKSVVASFAATSIYYNYFETADAYINAYSADKSTMQAFVDGILGEFEFTGKSPVKLKPVIIE